MRLSAKISFYKTLSDFKMHENWQFGYYLSKIAAKPTKFLFDKIFFRTPVTFFSVQSLSLYFSHPYGKKFNKADNFFSFSYFRCAVNKVRSAENEYKSLKLLCEKSVAHFKVFKKGDFKCVRY